MKSLRRFDTVLARLEGGLVLVFLGAMVFFTFVQVCLRGLYTYGHFQWANALMGHIDWSEPLVRLFVLWLTFLGASLSTSDNRHVRMDLFSALLPPKWIPFRELLLSVVAAAICGVMVWVCMAYIKLEMTFGATLFLNLPAWIGELILPVGFALMLFRFTLRAIEQGLEMAGRKAE